MIPHNVPSCNNSDKCLFAMSWTAYATDQYYHHCANILIKGANHGGKLPTLDMTIVDVSARHQKMNVHANGDDKSTKSSGPNPAERKLNLNGAFANGGSLKNKGINLGLIRG
ncbi:hypothetical protein BGX26_005296 [Mortierella sp. AD094]|nr:hypothetical protein BGX26_005296 [Mortierella sp. AD094]